METNKIKDGAVGLSYPVLTKGNYTTWSLKMKVNMQAHGVWEAVEPKDTKSNVEEKTDKVALVVIYQGLPEDILLAVAEKQTAKEVWEAIKTMCQGAERVKKAKIQALKAELESMSMKDTEQIDEFCMKLSGLVTNIRALGETIEESYVVKKLLRAVPTRFLQMTFTIEQFGNLESMTVEETVGSLKAHEERIKGKGEDSTGQLMLTKDEWNKREAKDSKLLLTKEEWIKRAGKGGTSGVQDQRFRGGRDKSKLRCYNCGLYGHFAAKCRRPKRDKEQMVEANMA